MNLYVVRIYRYTCRGGCPAILFWALGKHHHQKINFPSTKTGADPGKGGGGGQKGQLQSPLRYFLLKIGRFLLIWRSKEGCPPPPDHWLGSAIAISNNLKNDPPHSYLRPRRRPCSQPLSSCTSPPPLTHRPLLLVVHLDYCGR